MRGLSQAALHTVVVMIITFTVRLLVSNVKNKIMDHFNNVNRVQVGQPLLGTYKACPKLVLSPNLRYTVF